MFVNICSFYGNDEIEINKELEEKVKNAIKHLIVNHHVFTFLFDIFNDFTTLCYHAVTELKVIYPSIVKVKLNCIRKDNFGDEINNIERNNALIDESDYCVFYCGENIVFQSTTNSETKFAYLYAKQKNKTIINLINTKKEL